MTTTEEAGRLGGLARARKIASGEVKNKGGRPSVNVYCSKCGRKCPSAKAAKSHCKEAKRERVQIEKEKPQ